MRCSGTRTVIFVSCYDVIVTIGNDQQGISHLKSYLSSHFHMEAWFYHITFFFEIKSLNFLKDFPCFSGSTLYPDMLEEMSILGLILLTLRWILLFVFIKIWEMLLLILVVIIYSDWEAHLLDS